MLSEMSADDRALTLGCFSSGERELMLHEMSSEGMQQNRRNAVLSVEDKPKSHLLPDDGGPVSFMWDVRARAPRLADLNQSYAPKPVPPAARPANFDRETTWPEWAKGQIHHADTVVTRDHAEHAFNGIMFDVQCRKVPTDPEKPACAAHI